MILLAAAMVPTVIASKEAWRSPAGEVLRRSPASAVLGIAALGAALALSASYPALATAESSSSAMSGMVMDGGSASSSSTSSHSATVSTCVPHQSGLKISGLDLANSPFMIMGGTNGMDMNGADAERGSRLQHDDTQLALHRSRHPTGRGELLAGGWQQRAE